MTNRRSGKERMDSDRRTSAWTWIALLVLCLALRLAGIAWTPVPEVVKDAAQYDAIARNLLSGSYAIQPGVPTMHRLPGYPFFLAVIYAVCGHRLVWALVVQAVIDTLACFTLLWAGSLIYPDSRRRWVAVLPAALYAVYLPSILVTRMISSELLFCVLLIIGAYHLLVWFRDGRTARAAVAGFFLGLADMTRGGLLPFAGLVAALGALSRRRPGGAALLLASHLLVLTPWAVRNYVVFHQLRLYSTLGGKSLWAGNNPYSHGDYPPVASPEFRSFLRDRPEFVEYEKKAVDGRFAAEGDRAYARLAVQFMREHPGTLLRTVPRKLFRLYWAPFLPRDKPFSRWEKIALELMHLGILAGGLAGMLMMRGSLRAVLVMLPGYWTFLHIFIIYGMPRFAYPIMFVFMLLLPAAIPLRPGLPPDGGAAVGSRDSEAAARGA